jgi:hypothetical protein
MKYLGVDLCEILPPVLSGFNEKLFTSRFMYGVALCKRHVESLSGDFIHLILRASQKLLFRTTKAVWGVQIGAA